MSLAERWAKAGAGVRLVEGGARLTLEALVERAGQLASSMPEGPHVVVPREVSELVAGLLAAELRGVPLVLVRPSEPLPEEGELARLPQGFAVATPTSGTTGRAKFALHSVERLLGRVRPARGDERPVWLLTFAPVSFAGLQVILSALETGTLVVAPPGTAPELVATAAREEGVTHVSGTPTFWRAFAMQFSAGSEGALPLKVATLGGERSSQATLDLVKARFPRAKVGHIYATTETGSLFSVNDGREGFPRAWLEGGVEGVGLRVVDEELWVKSPRAMRGYLGESNATAASANAPEEGWIATGDLVSLAEDRVLFVGRKGRIINVGGAKVDPEEVEALLHTVPGVADAFVFGRSNPITGTLVAAELVLAPGHAEAEVLAAVRSAFDGFVAGGLARYKAPRVLKVVPQLALSSAGKKLRGAP